MNNVVDFTIDLAKSCSKEMFGSAAGPHSGTAVAAIPRNIYVCKQKITEQSTIL